jgi:hypothetical protein
MMEVEMNIRTQPIDHSTFAQLAEAGSLTEIHVVGCAGGWSVVVKYGANERVLLAQRGKTARLFKKMDTLVAYLNAIGISKFDVDAAGFDPNSGASRARPDRAKALRSAHEAAAHDAWFRAEVQRALDEANSGDAEWVAHDEAARSWAEKRKAMAGRSGGAQG